MRISYWSSDVCSSDLLDLLERVFGGRRSAGNQRQRQDENGKAGKTVHPVHAGVAAGAPSCPRPAGPANKKARPSRAGPDAGSSRPQNFSGVAWRTPGIALTLAVKIGRAHV